VVVVFKGCSSASKCCIWVHRWHIPWRVCQSYLLSSSHYSQLIRSQRLL
jgi:hypothetical protein